MFSNCVVFFKLILQRGDRSLSVTGTLRLQQTQARRNNKKKHIRKKKIIIPLTIDDRQTTTSAKNQSPGEEEEAQLEGAREAYW